MQHYSTEAFILKKEISAEKDNIYHFFTKDYGKINLVAKGARDILAKLAGHLELPSLVSINFSLDYRPRLITAIEKEPYSMIKNNAEALELAFKIGELVDEFTIIRQKDPELFKLLFDILYFIENNFQKSAKIISFAWLYFQARFLKLLGYEPFLGACVRCGNKDAMHFSFSERGLVCRLHRHKNDLAITPIQKKYLKAVFNISLGAFSSLILVNQVLEEKKFLEAFLEQFTLAVKSDIL